MAFKDRYAITKIIDENRDSLSISIDSGIRRLEDDEVGAVFLYTPDMGNTKEHFHIELTKDEVLKLRDWCDSFLNEPDLSKKYNLDLKNKK